jgi:hypothetical protein
LIKQQAHVRLASSECFHPRLSGAQHPAMAAIFSMSRLNDLLVNFCIQFDGINLGVRKTLCKLFLKKLTVSQKET